MPPICPVCRAETSAEGCPSCRPAGTEAESFARAGRAAQARGDAAVAVAAWRQVIRLVPSHLDALVALTGLLRNEPDRGEVREYAGRIAAVLPASPQAHFNLANAHRRCGDPVAAVAAYRRAVELDPAYINAHNNLAATLLDAGRDAEAAEYFRAAARLAPGTAWVQANLGAVEAKLGNWAAAAAAFEAAVRLEPSLLAAHSQLGAAYQALGRLEEAADCLSRCLRLAPPSIKLLVDLGNIFSRMCRPSQAAAAFEEAIRCDPACVEAWHNLGNALAGQGKVGPALNAFGRALELRPLSHHVHSQVLYAMHFDPRYDARAIRDAHREWQRRQEGPLLAARRPLGNRRDPGRKLKVGYVSPDFREHPVGLFVLPLLQHHDRDSFHVTCYSSVQRPDSHTRRCRAAVDDWREATALGDDRLADAIAADGIDVLVDLTMHMGDNRLLVFARKPAPVQVTYLAYCGTTGLEAMDYRITDRYLDPDGGDESVYPERTVRLPGCYWCYTPPHAPPVQPPPAERRGAVTFGCLNNPAKVSAPALQTWAGIMRAVPGSRLVLHAHPGPHRDEIRSFLQDRGVGPGRVHFQDSRPYDAYLASYGDIDISLDPFPYAGGTTSCDGLWMGVPLVTLCGATAVGRGGATLLSHLGLTELIAADPGDYQSIAIALADDAPKLRRLRASLRERMAASPLLDPVGFTRGMEGVYRGMWARYCQEP